MLAGLFAAANGLRTDAARLAGSCTLNLKMWWIMQSYLQKPRAFKVPRFFFTMRRLIHSLDRTGERLVALGLSERPQARNSLK